MISFRRNQGIRFCARFLSEFSEFFGRAAAGKFLSFWTEQKEHLPTFVWVLKIFGLSSGIARTFFNLNDGAEKREERLKEFFGRGGLTLPTHWLIENCYRELIDFSAKISVTNRLIRCFIALGLSVAYFARNFSLISLLIAGCASTRR